VTPLPAAKLILFYDGLCPLCSIEIAHYRRRAADDPGIVFQDITDPAFDATRFGLSPTRVHQEMHVLHHGKFRVGVDAFRAIWQTIPGYRWLDAFVGLPGMMVPARIAYWCFAKLRPFLPRRRRAADCPDGRCSL
jgi:predicted DCC family thiol-disulfide oxidoreductase YuxK